MVQTPSHHSDSCRKARDGVIQARENVWLKCGILLAEARNGGFTGLKETEMSSSLPLSRPYPLRRFCHHHTEFSLVGTAWLNSQRREREEVTCEYENLRRQLFPRLRVLVHTRTSSPFECDDGPPTRIASHRATPTRPPPSTSNHQSVRAPLPLRRPLPSALSSRSRKGAFDAAARSPLNQSIVPGKHAPSSRPRCRQACCRQTRYVPVPQSPSSECRARARCRFHSLTAPLPH